MVVLMGSHSSRDSQPDLRCADAVSAVKTATPQTLATSSGNSMQHGDVSVNMGNIWESYGDLHGDLYGKDMGNIW